MHSEVWELLLYSNDLNFMHIHRFMQHVFTEPLLCTRHELHASLDAPLDVSLGPDILISGAPGTIYMPGKKGFGGGDEDKRRDLRKEKAT